MKAPLIDSLFQIVGWSVFIRPMHVVQVCRELGFKATFPREYVFQSGHVVRGLLLGFPVCVNFSSLGPASAVWRGPASCAICGRPWKLEGGSDLQRPRFPFGGFAPLFFPWLEVWGGSLSLSLSLLPGSLAPVEGGICRPAWLRMPSYAGFVQERLRQSDSVDPLAFMTELAF